MPERSSRIIGAVVAIALAAAGFVGAAPAQADVIHVDMDCDPSGSHVVTITTNDTLSVVSTSLTGPCDTSYVILPFFPTPVGNVWLNGTLIPVDGNFNPLPGVLWTMTFASADPGSTHILFCGSSGAPPICPTLAITVVQAPEAIPAPEGIPAWQQSVGRPNSTSTCNDGWQPSWQEWAQPVTGGWVCTRSIPSLGH